MTFNQKLTAALLIAFMVVITLFAPIVFAADAKVASSFFDKVLLWFDALPAYIVMITTIVTAASTITAITPTKTDDKIVDFILRLLNWLSLNVFKNKNADDV